MNKTTNNLIIKTLGVLGIFVFSILVLPLKANAYGGFSYDGGAGSYYNGYSYVGDINTPTTATPTPTVNLVPTINSISPDSAVSSKAATVVTIIGTNFSFGSVAKWNGEERATTFVNSNKITTTLTPSDMSGLGAYTITVFNPLPGGGMSNSAIFQLNKASVAKSTTTTTATTVTTAKVVKKTTVAKSTTKSTDSSSSLMANALFGTNGLMPSSLIGWLLLLTLVLLIVIFARKAFVKEDKKHTPLKHA